MERITFFERYRVSVSDNGTPREIGRSGAAVTYRAVDLQSGEPVALKLIPMAAIDPAAREQFEDRVRAAQHVEHTNVTKLLAFIVDANDYVLISEFAPGETVASWVATHGPLVPDAALRVALQVVSALNAAAFHGLTHAAIEPSNIIIVPGQTTDGGWPAIKVANIDTSGLSLLPIDGDAPLVGAPIAPQFASPEQLQNGAADFRSEIYSLGATICFMLTGLAPLGSSAAASGESARLPSALRRVPRGVRELLADMLRINPEERPKDPVAFADRVRDCLASVEKRGATARRQGVPVSPALAVPRRRRIMPFPSKSLALAAMILALAAVAAILLAQPLRSAWRRNQDVTKIGVPVGVPEPAPSAVAQKPAPPQAPAPTAAQLAKAEASAAAPSEAPPAAQSQNAPAQIATTSQDSAPAATRGPTETTPNEVAANQQSAEPAAPAEGPAAQQPQTTATETAPAAPQSDTAADVASSSHSSSAETARPASSKPARTTKKVATSKRNSSRGERSDNVVAVDPDIASPEPPTPRGTQRAKFVGTTPDGEWIFDVPSGTGIVQLPPGEDAQRPRHRRRPRRAQRDEEAIPAEPAEPTVLRALPPDE
jgi:hypothetical protein